MLFSTRLLHDVERGLGCGGGGEGGGGSDDCLLDDATGCSSRVGVDGGVRGLGGPGPGDTVMSFGAEDTVGMVVC